MKYTKEKLEPIIKNSVSIAEVLRKLGLKPVGGNYRTINKYIDMYAFDVSHFTGQLWNKGKSLKTDTNSYLSRAALKKYFITTVAYICAECGVGEMYNGKSLTLHLDHIDGNSFNNLESNLRLLCPNCHSQTETYCMRK